jgi:hypothetical protein
VQWKMKWNKPPSTLFQLGTNPKICEGTWGKGRWAGALAGDHLRWKDRALLVGKAYWSLHLSRKWMKIRET